MKTYNNTTYLQYNGIIVIWFRKLNIHKLSIIFDSMHTPTVRKNKDVGYMPVNDEKYQFKTGLWASEQVGSWRKASDWKEKVTWECTAVGCPKGYLHQHHHILIASAPLTGPPGRPTCPSSKGAKTYERHDATFCCASNTWVCLGYSTLQHSQAFRCSIPGFPFKGHRQVDGGLLHLYLLLFYRSTGNNDGSLKVIGRLAVAASY